MASRDWFERLTGFTGNDDKVPFIGSAPAVAITDASQLQSSLLQLFTEAPHPDFGNGALIPLRLPLHIESDHVAPLANRLNIAEAHGLSGTPFLGAWCPDPSSETKLAFCGFVPNVLARWTRVENLVAYPSSRSAFAAAKLANDQTRGQHEDHR